MAEAPVEPSSAPPPRPRFDPGWLVIALAAVLLFTGIGEPAWKPFTRNPFSPLHYSWDEIFYAFTARRNNQGDPGAWNPDLPTQAIRAFDPTNFGQGSAYELQHPPLATHLIAGGMRLLGDGPAGARIPGALAGLLALFLLWRMARAWLPPWPAAAVPALLALDGTFFVLCRTAMPNALLVLYAVAAAAAVLKYRSEEKPRARWLFAAGLACGAAAATKWASVPFSAAAALVALAPTLRDGFRGTLPARDLARRLGVWFAAFVLLPGAIYLAVYAPVLLRPEWGWDRFVLLQRHMLHHHLEVPPDHLQGSPWWTWGFLPRWPIFFSERRSDGLARTVVCAGNPVLWVTLVPVTLWLAARAARRRRPVDALLTAGILAAWLPSAFVSRFTFSYYLLPGLPFACLGLVTGLEQMRAAFPRTGRFLLPVLVLAAAGAFASAYGTLAGLWR